MSFGKFSRALFTALFLMIAGMQVRPATATPAIAPDDPRYRALLQQADKEGTVRVIVGLNIPFSGATRQSVASAQPALRQARTTILNTIAASGGRQTAPDWVIPYLAVEVNRAGLEALARLSLVNDIDEDQRGTHADDGSNTLVNTAGAWSKGYRGGGLRVAVLDSGTDRNHPFLAGRVVLEACFSTSGGSAQTLCPNGTTTQTGTGAAQPCFVYASGCEHGTHVAGIVAGYGSGGGGVGYDGVATSAQIFAINMFYRDIPSGNAFYYTSNLISGLNHVYNTSSGNNIVAVNMSLGTFALYNSVSSCESAESSTKAVIDLLRNVNIASIAATGNNGVSNGTSAPACISSTLSVGAVSNTDVIASFSNSASWLNFLAPGVAVNSSLPNNTYAAYSGTSMATPHVAGAWALLRHLSPNASIQQIKTVLLDTGVAITDSRNNITAKRINIGAATKRLLPNRVRRLGIYRNGVWVIRRTANNAGGAATLTFSINAPVSNTWPVVGDWNGDGLDSAGVYDRSTGVFYLSNVNGFGALDYSLVLGNPNDLPIAGRWQQDAANDGVGVFRPTNGIIYLKNMLTSGFADVYMVLGNPGDRPVAGDWDGDGVESPGVFRPSASTFYLTNYVMNGVVFGDYAITFGASSDQPLAGDWLGYAHAGIGIFRNGSFALRHQLTSGGADLLVTFGATNDIPVAGRWQAETLFDPAPTANPFLNAQILVDGTDGYSNAGTDGSAD
jgi:subtilisin